MGPLKERPHLSGPESLPLESQGIDMISEISSNSDFHETMSSLLSGIFPPSVRRERPDSLLSFSQLVSLEPSLQGSKVQPVAIKAEVWRWAVTERQ